MARKKTIEYYLQPSGQPVTGTRIGEYMAIRKETYGISGKRKRYVIDHLPTGYRMFNYDKLSTARAVAEDLDAEFGEMLNFTNPTKAKQLLETNTELLNWAMLANRYPKRADYEASAALVRGPEKNPGGPNEAQLVRTLRF